MNFTVLFLFFYCTLFFNYCKNNEVKNISNVVNLDGLKVNKDVENIKADSSNNLNLDNKTMYSKLFGNIELSADEEKLIGIEKNIEEYDKTDAKYTSFYNIKYDVLKWEIVKNRDIITVDLYSKKQKSYNTIQDLGIDGSSSFSLIPEIIFDIGTSFGYIAYDKYKINDNDLMFFDTKMPIGDVKASFNLDSGDGFMTSIKTYLSANSNIHLGFFTDIVLKRRVLSQKTNDNLNLAIINFPISSYFLYKSTDERLISLVNVRIGNYIHSDHGGTNLDGNPKYIGDRDLQDVLPNVLKRRLMSLNLLGYLQYKFNKICVYGQYNFNYESNKLNISAEKEKKTEIIDGRKKSIIRYENKINDKTINNIFKDPELDKYYSLKNNDSYLENILEIGVKDNILIKRNLYFNYSVYYSIKLSTRSITSAYNITPDVEKDVSSNILKREWYIDPFTLGCNLNIYGITFSPKLTVSGKSVYFRLFFGYNIKYFNLTLNLARHKIPLLFSKYKCFNDKVRSYDMKYDKAPLDLYINIDGDIKVKDILRIKPKFSCNIAWNKVYFKEEVADNDGNISIPSQNKNALFHLTSSVIFNVKFLKYFYVEINPIINKKLYFKKNIDFSENENDDNVPLFSLSSRFYFYNEVRKGVVEVTAGTEVFWRTNYNPNSFDMITQQYFSQNYEDKFNVLFKPKVNLYCNIRFGNFIGSFKINLLNIFWNSNTFASKYYPNNNDYYMFTIQYLMY